MEKYHARIRGRATLYKKLRLHGYGLVYDKKRRGWEVKTDDKKWLEGLSKECHRLHLNCIVTPTRYTRSTTYRGAYFKEHPGILHHRYFCAYCGRLLPKKKITIDHLIPVQKASNEKRYRPPFKRPAMKNATASSSIFWATPASTIPKIWPRPVRSATPRKRTRGDCGF